MQGKTLGVPLFPEQAMRVAVEFAGFTVGEAAQLRRAMVTFKFTGGVSASKEKLVRGMVARGYELEPSGPSANWRASIHTASRIATPPVSP